LISFVEFGPDGTLVLFVPIVSQSAVTIEALVRGLVSILWRKLDVTFEALLVSFFGDVYVFWIETSLCLIVSLIFSVTFYALIVLPSLDLFEAFVTFETSLLYALDFLFRFGS
jgi:hypothetical protein